MRPNTLSRALMQLECFGFIEIERGGLEHQPSIYTLVDRWKESYDSAKLEACKAGFEELLERKKLAQERKRSTS